MLSISILNNLIHQANIGLKFILPDDVAGWCSPELGSLLGNLMSGVPKNYLEVGTFCGKSLIYTLRNNPNARAFVIDPLPDSMIVGKSTVWQEWNKNIDAYGLREQITLYRERVEDFAGSISGIDIAFIDGNHDSGHTYETLKKCEQYLADEALIIIDDYNIYGGNQQTAFPGHEVDIKCPVKTDVHRYISENSHKISILAYTDWQPNGHLYLRFKRS